MNDDWNSGFSSVTANDLVFGEGATYWLRPTAQGVIEQLSISGSLVLPSAMNYNVERTGSVLQPTDGSVIVSAGEGVSGSECSWTGTGFHAKSTGVVVVGDDLVFLFKPNGMVLSFR